MATRPCDVENTADFHRYYSNSWLGLALPDTDYITPTLMAASQDDRVQVRSLVPNPDKATTGIMPYVLNGYSEHRWKAFQNMAQFGKPDIGMSPSTGSVVFLAYSTPRNAHKGLRPNELRTYDFNSWNIRKKFPNGMPRTDQYGLVWNAFNPTYATIPEAIAQLDSGKTAGVALSRVFAVYSIPDCPFPLLAYKRWTIGYFQAADSVRVYSAYTDYSSMVSNSLRIEVRVA